MRIKKVRISLLKAPLNQPFRTALGAHHYLENVLFAIELKDGVKGFGEAAIATHITQETVPQTVRNLRRVGNGLIGRGLLDYLKISFELRERLSKNKAALAAVEMALLDALTKEWNIPLWQFFGNKPQILRSDVTVVLSGLKEAEASVRKYYKKGFRAFKVKIGGDFDLDFKRVLAVKKIAPRSNIYLDANQSFSAREMVSFLRQLHSAHVKPQLVEQPVFKDDWEGLKKVTREGKVPVCADESVQNIEDARRLIKEKAAHAINIKLMKFGLWEAREIALLAKANGLKLMMGGMMETSLAMTAAAHLAAGLGCFDFIDLDTPFFIKRGYDRNPYLSSDGVYDLRKVKRGIGIA